MHLRREPTNAIVRHMSMSSHRSWASVVVAACSALLATSACSEDASEPTSKTTPQPTTQHAVSSRWVGDHHVAVAVPAVWQTEVQPGNQPCPPVDPETVMFFSPMERGPLASCVVPDGASWPARNSVSIYRRGAPGVPAARGEPAGSVGDMPYYISNGRQTGPGVAVRLVVPQAGIAFLVGAADRDKALAILSTIRYVPDSGMLR